LFLKTGVFLKIKENKLFLRQFLIIVVERLITNFKKEYLV